MSYTHTSTEKKVDMYRTRVEKDCSQPLSDSTVMNAGRNKKNWSARKNYENHSGNRTQTAGLDTLEQSKARSRWPGEMAESHGTLVGQKTRRG